MTDTGEQAFFAHVAFILLLAMPTIVLASDNGKDEPIYFDIPQQRADLALIQFAEQAELTLMFPFEKVQEKSANRLVGRYPNEVAIEILLAGTGLKPTFSDGAVLRIMSDEQPTPEGDEMRTSRKAGLAAILATVFSVGVGAQDVENADNKEIEEVVVTGTRLARSGYDTPTPVTVLGMEQLEADAPHNIADIVNQLPSVVGSTTPNNANLSISAGGAGINGISLRSLGRQRTLVLVDGRRAAGAAKDGVVDINTIPQPLIDRVEVVTGGASAVYGSDALSGIVNFILDKDYVGVKGEISGGQTTYGDDDTVRATLTVGSELFGGRGHFIASGETAKKDGIFGVPRSWNNGGNFTMFNPDYSPTNGQPEMLRLSQVGLSTALGGGIITDTALRGTAFGNGGVPYQFQYGDLIRDPWMQGGDWLDAQANDKVTLTPLQERDSIYARLSYDFTDNFQGFFEYSNTNSRNQGWCCSQFNVANINILADNAFIPPSVAAQLTTLGITDFTLGSMNGDLYPIRSKNERGTERFSIGADGDFDLFGSNWSYDAYVQRGVTNTIEDARTTNRSHFTMAIDAVFDPATGQIVCRSTLTDPNNGCKPYNLMGVGVNSDATINYLYRGDGVDKDLIGPIRYQEFTQEVFGLSMQGAPFSIPTGEVSMAFGYEHRSEEVSGQADSVSANAGWFNGNYLPIFGKYTVDEIFFETVVPIVEDRFEFNGAVRATDYSTSGNVTTWKAGLTFSPTEDIRLRTTLSRDIRAPNLGELFETGGAQTNSVSDPFNNNETVQFLGIISGNPNLQPEIADTFGFGIILEPSILPNLRMSIDYYDIEISDAIASLSVQSIVDRCFEGNQSFCDAITRGVGPGGTLQITEVRRSPFNFVKVNAKGIDFAANYGGVYGLGGDWSFQAIATNYLEEISDDGITQPSDSVGENGGTSAPDWIYRASATYSRQALSTTLTVRGMSDGVYDNDYVSCTTGCPASNSVNRTVNFNTIPSAYYFDLSASYDFGIGNSDAEVYFVARNLLNRDPETIYNGPGGVSHQLIASNPSLYDLLGTVYRVGLRVEF